MQTPPQVLQKELDAISHAIRHSHVNELHASRLGYYHTFVRTHVMDVVQQTFPNFYRSISEASQADYADKFVRTHAAIEPEFYHIATEFVRFMQQDPGLDLYLLKMLEYEWVLLSVSLATDRIDPANTTITLSEVRKDRYFIALNPTLCCIEVPFLITNEGLQPIKEKTFFYGIFRNAEHQVLYKILNAQEHHLVQLLRKTHLLSYNDIMAHTPFSSIDGLGDWLMQSYITRFINIIRKETP